MVDELPACSWCGSREKSKRCPCKLVRYCSTRCQELDWVLHKSVCADRARRKPVSISKAIAIATAAQRQMETELLASSMTPRSFREIPDIVDARLGTTGPVPNSSLQVLCSATSETQHLLQQPCVICGKVAQRFCDGGEIIKMFNKGSPCFAAARMPKGDWLPNQRTPMCGECDNFCQVCYYCRSIPWCSPPRHHCHVTSKLRSRFFVALALMTRAGKAGFRTKMEAALRCYTGPGSETTKMAEGSQTVVVPSQGLSFQSVHENIQCQLGVDHQITANTAGKILHDP